MHIKIAKQVVLVLLVALVSSGCGFGTPEQAATPSTSRAQQTAPRATQGATAAPTATAPTDPQQFAINQTASSDQSALENIELVIYRAALDEDTLTLHIGFRNTSESGYNVFGGPGARDAVLEDASGTEYEPTEISATLNNIAPSGGFGPGAANVGDLSFPRPNGDGPFTFRFPTYAPITFRLDTVLADDAIVLPEGTYQIGQQLRSQQQALSQIVFEVRALDVTPDSLIFDVAFVNTARQGYDLIIGPKGGDARLLDAEGQQYTPSAISAELEGSIAPADGWLPGQANAGTISFPRPDAGAALRLVFPNYNALTLRFDQRGLAAVEITSPTGDAPLPTLTPSAEDRAFAQIEQLLAQQAEALQNGNVDGYLATLAPALQEQQRAIAERIQQAPLVSYTLRLAPAARLDQANSGELANVPIEILYTLRGIDVDNVFLHEVNVSFTRDGDAWRVSNIAYDDNPPFWTLGDFVVREMPHFLIFARPEAQAELPTLEQEAETAYTMLQQQGLALEPRYVAYFAATSDEFSALTGRQASRYLGLALSRYEFSDDQIITTSRAFYINGGVFAEQGNQFNASERQTTITHELVHLALAKDTRPFTPPWLSEGIAVFYSGETGPAHRERLLDSGQLDGLSLQALTAAGSLGEHDFTGERVGAEYTFSGETVAYLVEQFGEEQVLAFYRSYAAVPAADVREKLPRFGGSVLADAAFADLSTQLTADALQQFFGLTIDELDAAVKAEIR